MRLYYLSQIYHPAFTRYQPNVVKTYFVQACQQNFVCNAYVIYLSAIDGYRSLYIFVRMHFKQQKCFWQLCVIETNLFNSCVLKSTTLSPKQVHIFCAEACFHLVIYWVVNLINLITLPFTLNASNIMPSCAYFVYSAIVSNISERIFAYNIFISIKNL